MTVYSNVLDMIGNTPMLRLNDFDTGPCELYLKLELANPGGSIKDRIAVSMIEAAERRGEARRCLARVGLPESSSARAELATIGPLISI